MVKIYIDDSVQVRVACSPLWETVASIDYLSLPKSSVSWPFDGWLAKVRSSLSSMDVESVVNRMSDVGRTPEFLNMPLVGVNVSFEEQLDRMYFTKRNSQLLSRYWDCAVAPYWAAMRTALDEEVLRLGRTLITAGTDALLADFSGDCTWERPWLSLSTADTDEDEPAILCEGEIVIVPLLFARGSAVHVTGEHGCRVSYQARGSVVFSSGMATDKKTVEEDKLAILLGRARANVLRALQAPTTTSMLARVLGLSASTVSEHLSTLVAAGVVKRRRNGVRVIYELRSSGAELLRSFDDGHRSDALAPTSS